MKHNKLFIALFLAIFFVTTFLAVFLWISNNYSAYSNPSYYHTAIGKEGSIPANNFAISLGPEPNSTDVELDTVISVHTWRSALVNDFRSTPQIQIAKESVKIEGLGPTFTFYPAETLKPSTTYNVTMFIYARDVSWSFTTTPEPFQMQLRHYFAAYVFWIALSASSVTTLTVGFVFRFLKKKRQVLFSKEYL